MSHDTEASPGDVVRQEPHRDVPAGCPQQQRFSEEQGGDGPRLWDRDHQPVLCSAGSALSGMTGMLTVVFTAFRMWLSTIFFPE